MTHDTCNWCVLASAGLRVHGGTLTQLQIVKAPFPPIPVGSRLCHSGSGLLGCHVVTDVPMALCGAALAHAMVWDLLLASGSGRYISPCDSYMASVPAGQLWHLVSFFAGRCCRV